MEEEIKKILNKNLAVSEETLKIIKKIHRVQSVGRFLKVFKWLMIAALSFGFYYYFTIMNNQIDLGRSLAFGSLIAAQVFLILMMREWQQVKSNLLLLLIPFFTLIALFAIFAFSPLRGVFHLSALTSFQAMLMFLVPLAAIGILAVGRKIVGRVGKLTAMS